MRCSGAADGPGATSPRSLPNPSKDAATCGRPGSGSFVCDPDALLAAADANNVDLVAAQLKKQGNFVGVAVMKELSSRPQPKAKGVWECSAAASKIARRMLDAWDADALIMISLAETEFCVETKAGRFVLGAAERGDIQIGVQVARRLPACVCASRRLVSPRSACSAQETLYPNAVDAAACQRREQADRPEVQRARQELLDAKLTAHAATFTLSYLKSKAALSQKKIKPLTRRLKLQVQRLATQSPSPPIASISISLPTARARPDLLVQSQRTRAVWHHAAAKTIAELSETRDLSERRASSAACRAPACCLPSASLQRVRLARVVGGATAARVLLAQQQRARRQAGCAAGGGAWQVRTEWRVRH